MEVNYYELFGVNPNATIREIRIAYRRMAEVYHPDKLRELPGKIREEGEDIMRLLNEAKSILMNPERRLEYDVVRGYRSPEAEQAIVFFLSLFNMNGSHFIILSAILKQINNARFLSL